MHIGPQPRTLASLAASLSSEYFASTTYVSKMVIGRPNDTIGLILATCEHTVIPQSLIPRFLTGYGCSGVARVFPGGELAHPEGQNEELEEN